MVVETGQGPRVVVVLGPKLLADKLYDQSSAEVTRVFAFFVSNLEVTIDMAAHTGL
jgi:hypothetical protein